MEIGCKCPFDARIDQILSGWEPLSGGVVASKSPAALRIVNIRHQSANGLSWVAVVCLTAILVSTIIQTTHFCGLRAPDAQAAVELDRASSGSPVCLNCLMAPSMSAIILLVAFFTMSACAAFVGRMQMRPKPVLHSFRLYIRPPPLDLA
jgi:hypothetical protein